MGIRRLNGWNGPTIHPFFANDTKGTKANRLKAEMLLDATGEGRLFSDQARRVRELSSAMRPLTEESRWKELGVSFKLVSSTHPSTFGTDVERVSLNSAPSPLDRRSIVGRASVFAGGDVKMPEIDPQTPHVHHVDKASRRTCNQALPRCVNSVAGSRAAPGMLNRASVSVGSLSRISVSGLSHLSVRDRKLLRANERFKTESRGSHIHA
eukprot:GEMP01073449.1.p1 GENE.GEMP01073449.1~~GEMP01073449.1.p1  ORF type:complete len:226 (+),score=41.16 GEMP01073449.1:49-678(+)